MSVPAAAADLYKWVDERGVTTYGTKPPAGRPATRVDTTPRNTIDTGGVPAKAASERMAPPYAPPPAAVGTTAVPARGMDFDTYVRIQRGMSEGEVLARAGRPDHVVLESVGNSGIVKAFYWYPTTADPFITVVTIHGGRVDNIERTRKF